MELKDLKLEAVTLTEPPTKTQIINILRDVSQFLTRMGAAVVLDGSYSVSDPPLGETLNAATKLKQCAQAFEDGPNASGLALPQPVPGRPQVVGGR